MLYKESVVVWIGLHKHDGCYYGMDEGAAEKHGKKNAMQAATQTMVIQALKTAEPSWIIGVIMFRWKTKSM